jgi:TP901 family phage tail tape measure protein
MRGASAQAMKTANRIKTAHMVIAGVAALAIGKSVSLYAQFERKMVTAGAVANATAEEFADMSNTARAMGKNSEHGANKAADAMKFMGMAGFNAQEQMGSLEHVLNLATAAEIEVGRAADITTNIMRGYGLETSQLAATNDVLVKTLTSSNTNLEQLGHAFKFAGPIAKVAGMRFEELAAVFGRMGNAAMQSGMAGRAMRMGLIKLAKPTNESKEALGALGVEIHDGSGGMRNFIDILHDLNKAGAQLKHLQSIFGTRAASAIITVLGDADGALQEYVKTLDKATGSTNALVKAKLETVSGQWNLMKAQWEEVAIVLGKLVAPAVKYLIKSFRDFGGQVAWVMNAIRSDILNFQGGWAIAGAAVDRVWNGIKMMFTTGAMVALEMIASLLNGIADFLLMLGKIPGIGDPFAAIGESIKATAGEVTGLVDKLVTKHEELLGQDKKLAEAQTAAYAGWKQKRKALDEEISALHKKYTAEQLSLGTQKQINDASAAHSAELQKLITNTDLFNAKVSESVSKLKEFLDPAAAMTFEELRAAAPAARASLEGILAEMEKLDAQTALGNLALEERTKRLETLGAQTEQYKAIIAADADAEVVRVKAFNDELEKQSQIWGNLTQQMAQYTIENVAMGHNAEERWKRFNSMMIRGLTRYVTKWLGEKAKMFAFEKLTATKSIGASAAEGAAAVGKSEAKKGTPWWVIPVIMGAVFAGIMAMTKKMHSGGVFEPTGPRLPGLGPGEGVAILQSGEEVIPRGGGGTGGVTVNYNAVFPQSQLEVDQFVDEALVPALKRRQLAGAF